LNDLSRQTDAMADQLAAAVNRVIDRGRYILGPENEAFEEAFAAYCGVPHAVGVANGTDAIELALRAIGVQAGHAVVTAANAGFYTSAAVLAIGATPVFVDVDPITFLMSLDSLRSELIATPVQCVVLTHLYGRMVDVDAIIGICEPRGIPALEDCAQAHGAARAGRRAGSFGAAGCFSFYPTKNLGALGDGGAVVTRDAQVAARIRALRQYGWEQKYRVAVRGGRNSRLDEMQAAILNVKLPHLDDWNRRRRTIAQRYANEIIHPRVQCPRYFGEDHAAHLFVVCCDDRDGLRHHLETQGVSTDIHYPIPDHRQTAIHDMLSAKLAVTERLAEEILTLPCFPEMTEDEVAHVISAVNGW
jgi:dTDP-3-amino-2,3,6-trideoxy-4-keto-D-glucose/dTDP-3-amino-3,4,6-trideoxy-alpha-D-glucose/dTDP-2,6-dideoxy-D-kanosamine transaminase